MRPDKLIEQYEEAKKVMEGKREKLAFTLKMNEAAEERIIELLEIQEKAVVAGVELKYPTLGIRAIDVEIIENRKRIKSLKVEIDEKYAECSDIMKLIKAEGWVYYRPFLSVDGVWSEI